MSLAPRLQRALALALGGLVAAASALRSPAVDAEVDDGERDAAWEATPLPILHTDGTSLAAYAANSNAGKRGGGVYAELPTRTIAEWTPAQVRRALTDADSGLLMTAADLVEAIMGDDRVQGVLSTRTHGLLGLPIQFHSSGTTVELDEGQIDPKTALEGVKALGDQTAVPGDWAKMFPENELARFVAWGIVLGIGIAERVPDDERAVGEREVPRMKLWHPRWLRWQWNTDQWFLMTADGEIEIHPGDGRWIFYTPYGLHRPWAQGAWRPISFAWVLKQFALHDRARHCEVLGSPARVGFAPQGAKEGSRRGFLRDLRAMGRDNAMVLPEGWDLKMVEANATARGEIYTSQIEWADRAIAITLAGQAVTTEGTTGFSNGNIHAAIKHDLIVFTAESLSTCLRDQGVKPWASVNYGDPEAAPWGKHDCSPPEDKKTTAEAYAALGDGISKLDAALKPSTRRVDAVALASKFGIPLAEEAPPAPVQPLPSLPAAKEAA